MSTITVFIATSTLAVVIGIVELLVSELFRTFSERASAWRRRRVLHRTGRLALSAAARSAAFTSLGVTIALVILMAFTIVLELKLDTISLRSTKLAPWKCYAPDRTTRYGLSNGPTQAEIEDTRLDDYIEDSKCGDRLFELVLQGSELYDKGYPQCAKPFANETRVHFEAKIFGCGVGHVANQPLGD